MKNLKGNNSSTEGQTGTGREIIMNDVKVITENAYPLLDELDLPHDAVQFSIKKNKVRIELSV
jgi:hypothetical protein